MEKLLDALWQFLVRVFRILSEGKGETGPEPKGEKDLEPALRLIKKWEGFRSRAYLDPVGIWTIGYGTIRYSNGQKVKAGDVISQEMATEELLVHAEKEVLPVIDKEVRVGLNNNQYCALVSFIYNLGSGNFRKSTLLKKLNRGDYEGAAREFDRWVYAGGKKLKGLVRRRDEEQLLFVTPAEGRVN